VIAQPVRRREMQRIEERSEEEWDDFPESDHSEGNQ
jgi:hypothetical protein